jgi:predicted glycogen debranching enzyme
MTNFDPTILSDLEAALAREWLETDGRGGFASSTIIGANTRRYHGLLVAATQPPVARRVLVAKIEDRLLSDGALCATSANVYEGGVVHPEGHLHQAEFRLDPWPVLTWRDRDFVLQKSIVMPHRQGFTILRYDLLEGPRAAWLHARPLVAGRDMHHLQQSSGHFDSRVVITDHGFRMQPYDPPSRLALHFPGGEFRPDGLWYYDFHYPREQERGLDCSEDLYSPGEIVWLLRPGETAWLILGQDPAPDALDPAAALDAERDRRAQLLRTFGDDEPAGRLALAADQFIVDRVGASVPDAQPAPAPDAQPSRTIIAGYPWFGDWGRDTMIALFGLTLATGRHADCRAMLHTFLTQMRHGLAPNLFAEDTGEALYNTVDATLWLFVAVHRYVQAARDVDFLREAWPALQASLEAHLAGTDFGIHVTADGLLAAGDESTQLTWMDAKVGDWVVTPRHGQPVEINGLWYNALKIGEACAKKLKEKDAAQRYGAQAQQTQRAFGQFWSPELGYCHDVLRPEGPDSRLRPNQLIALALPYKLLTPPQRRSILEQATAHLLTPYGLRTLAPGSEGYAPHYAGDQRARDGAYHQGTVWPWLIGPYLSLYFDVMGLSDETRLHARTLLEPLLAHLDDAGLGSISEIFDAEPPFTPRGCIAQAWSVGEVLRCWVEYGLGQG